MKFRAILAACSCAALLSIADDIAMKPARPSVFQIPILQQQLQRLQIEAGALLKQGKFAEAEKKSEEAVRLMPDFPVPHYNLACMLALQGKTELALERLTKAVELGFSNPDHILRDPDWEKLRDDDRFKKIVDRSREKPKPNPALQFNITLGAVSNAVAHVTETNSMWSPEGIFRIYFQIPASTNAALPIIKGRGEAGDLLRLWQKEGTAAGNHGDFYDNHDTDHSNMDYAGFPQLTRIEYSKEAQEARLHHGAQANLLFNQITIGNSSTALVSGPFWRSQPRFIHLNLGRAPFLYSQYTANQLYFYPEHRDHDLGRNGKPPNAETKDGGFGDVYPFNSPYMIISQGSSGSDIAFMDATTCALAAFRPEVKTLLARTGTLMPAVQMVFRNSNKPVAKTEDYLTGKAHPTVFESKNLDVPRMVKLAHSFTTNSIPPMIQLRAIEEDTSILGVDYFDVAERERLFDTPCAIARVHHSTRLIRRMVISAESSKDITGRPLTFHWSVLRGDVDRIKINKLNPAGSRVELLVPWQERKPSLPGASIESTRVDIGAFVHNGDHYSAPGFVSIYSLENEHREYHAHGTIKIMDYDHPDKRDNYVDPVLFAAKRWRDEYHYDAIGKLTGWTRNRGAEKEEFSADGSLILKRDDLNRPIETQRVRYTALNEPNKAPVLVQEKTPIIQQRQYKDKSDRVGTVREN